MADSRPIPTLPAGLKLGARASIAVAGVELSTELRLAGVDSNGAWFLSVPPDVSIPVGQPVTLTVLRGDGVPTCFHAYTRRMRRHEGLPGSLRLEDIAPAGLAPDESTEELVRSALEIPPMRVVVRSAAVRRPVVGEVVRLGAEEVLLRVRKDPGHGSLTLSFDPPEAFLQAKADALQESRPNTNHTYWRLQKVYAVYFAGIDAELVGPAIPTGGDEWLVHARFHNPHAGCAELVRFLEEQSAKAAEQRAARQRAAQTIWQEGLLG